MKVQSNEPTPSRWKDLYQTALVEQNHGKQAHLASKAHTAIMARMLSYVMVGRMEETLANPEYQELADALGRLRVTKRTTQPGRPSLAQVSETIAG